MPQDRVLLFTDVVDSTQITEHLGDSAAAALWIEHDRIARRLLRTWNGKEIDKSDGFLLLFDSVDQAVGFALALQQALQSTRPPLRCRAGVHCGALSTRQNSPDDIELGAKPLEVDGVAKAVASRIMMLAQGGQTLLSAAAAAALNTGQWRVQSHGHWRMKGLAEPVEVFEAGDHHAPFAPPPDSVKSYRVVPFEEGWTPVAQIRHGLPAERDSFVGRVDTLRALAERFDDGARLVSVLGIGGIGKTRLALRYARYWLGDYPGGAWFCDLSPASTLDGIVHATAQGLDVPLGKTDPVEQLGAAIAGRGQSLVILDNFEQVASHAEACLGRWLDAAPQARFLVTSREVLGIGGEHAFILQPLATADAMKLFERRAAAADGRPSRAEPDHTSINSLVELLDRLPLAIELAAARVRVMSPRAMLDRVGERFRLLASRSGRKDRQATLRATLDWSWDLLKASERSALAQLSVFEGGFSIDAAQAVVDLSEFDPAPWLVDVVQSLLDKSLLRQADEQRLDMLRSVRDYAAERLVNAPLDASKGQPTGFAAAAARHWRYFATFDELQATAQRCVDAENLVAAARRATAARDLDAAAGAVAAAWYALRLTGPISTAVSIARDSSVAAGEHRGASATARWVMGNAHHLLGQPAQARQLLEQALADAQNGSALAGRILCTLGVVESSVGDHGPAGGLLERALEIARQNKDSVSACRALNGLGALADTASRPDEARRWYESALEVARAARDARWEGAVLGNLAQLHHQQGHIDAARSCYHQGLELVSLSGDLRFEANMRCNLGLLHHECGQRQSAASELQSVLEIAQRIGHVQLQGVALANLGLVEEAEGRLVEAIGHCRAAVDVADSLNNKRDASLYRVYLGRLLARHGLRQDALDCLARALELLDGTPNDRIAALAQCALVEASNLAGDPTSASRHAAQMRTLCEAIDVPRDAELAREVAQVERLISRC